MQNPTLRHVRCDVRRWTGAMDDHTHDIWRSLVRQRADTPVFSYPEWFEIACHVGIVDPWGIVLLYREDHPIGLIPLRKRSLWSAEIVTNLADDYPPLLIMPYAEEEAWAGLALGLDTRAIPGMIHIGYCADAQRVAAFQRSLSDLGAAHAMPTTPDYCLFLPDSWEAYLASLGSNTRGKTRHHETHLTEKYPSARVEFVEETGKCDDVLLDLIRLYRMRWRDQIGGNLFDNPRNVAFYLAATRWAHAQGYVAVAALRVEDRVIAASTTFHVPGSRQAYYHLMARDMNALPRNFSPGIVLLNHVLRWAIARGVEQFWFGNGCRGYKVLQGGTECPRWALTASRSRRTAALLPIAEAAVHFLSRAPVHLHYHTTHMLRWVSDRVHIVDAASNDIHGQPPLR